ncbi:MAG TPA: hypothetical protein DEB31_11520 [Clostridiales bacterium]|nr:hypothetical protein [Clostridiales bacterium]
MVEIMTGKDTVNPQLSVKKKLPKRRIAFIVILAVVLVLAFTWAVFTDVIILRKTEDMEGAENSTSILFVGTSDVFVGNLPQQLQAIARTHNVHITYKDISRHANRGGTLREHRENAINEMQSGRFDYVVFQDDQIRNDMEGFLDDVRLLSDEARKNGVIPVLFNSACAFDQEHLNMNTASYKQAADEADTILVNAADAWVYAYPKIPGISLITRFDPRGPHPSKAGGFLTACVFAATLFDLHIEEIPKDSLYKGNDAVDLAQVAWEFVNPLHEDG